MQDFVTEDCLEKVFPNMCPGAPPEVDQALALGMFFAKYFVVNQCTCRARFESFKKGV